MLTAPIRLDSREAQETAFEPVRLRPEGDERRLEVKIEGDWLPIYDIAPGTPLDIDFIAPNWFTSTHPDSIFRRTLIVSRTTADVRYMLAENLYTARRRDGAVERRRLTVDKLERALIEDFHLPAQPDWRPVLARAVAVGGM